MNSQHARVLNHGYAGGCRDCGPARRIQQGYQPVYWRRSAIMYWAVSDVSADDLRAIVQLYQLQAELPATR